jgi:FkbM family methyltransferase
MINVPFYSHPSTRNDEWVIKEVFQGMRAGYYVEAGAFDGLTHSNTLALERSFCWDGLLIEPHPTYIPQVHENRPDATLIPKALGVTGMTKATLLLGGQWSGLQELMPRTFLEGHTERLNPGVEVDVITLHQALEEANAPRTIDYLSLDTEGSELPIMLDYFLNTDVDDLRTFRCLSIEYGYDATILSALNLLLDHWGYEFVRLSGWDSFYVAKDSR